MKKRLLCLSVLLMLLFSACTLSRADFGDFSGGSDYGGSDYGGSDYSSSDYGSSGSYYYDDDDWGIEGVILVFGMVAVIVIISIRSEKSKSRPKGAKGVDKSTLKPVSALSNFNESELTGRLSNMYIRLQEAWANGDLSPVEPLLTAPYYAQMASQLKREFTDKGITSHLEHMSVLEVNLLGCIPSADGQTPDRLYVSLRTRFVNYLTDKDGKVIRGSRKDEIYMHYEWTLERSEQINAKRSINCPNCGAAVDANRFAKCPYCGSVIENSGYDWVISSIKGISRKTVKH